MRVRWVLAAGAMTLAVILGASAKASAAPIEYTTLAGYNAAVGSQTVVTFVGLADGAVLGGQYSGLGVTFSDGNDLAFISGCCGGDGALAQGGSNTTLTLDFNGYRDSIGVEYPGAVRFRLYDGLTLVYTSSNFGGSGSGFFAGISGVSFNRALVDDWFQPDVFIDNLRFDATGAAAVPEPASLLLLGSGIAGVAANRRRRRQR